ncbi:hypothetical protein NZ698_15305 [Chryseobacterium sp. PBS4-4]|uniref:Uncharacterized protein n=1 Tax=Chryseobacterium edaphi TaxID=2976532 RepID=A0ABT2WD62_9FLAO|nr:hypothetical protein [Chryseobacterium edaphi]MCU7618560.1 hypothetical protein [Chryseobacterium edaphi]
MPQIKENGYVLYLRSFTSDDEINHWKYGLLGGPEAVIKRTFKDFGPLIGLGANGKEASFGGYRIFSTDDHWRDIIFNLINYAGLIALYMDDRPEVQWELSLCLKHANPEKFIIYIDKGRKKNIKILNSFDQIKEKIPLSSEKQRFIAFDKNWVPFEPRRETILQGDFKAEMQNFIISRKSGLPANAFADKTSINLLKKIYSRKVLIIIANSVSFSFIFFSDIAFYWLVIPVILAIINLVYIITVFNWIFRTARYLELKIFTTTNDYTPNIKKISNLVNIGFVVQLIPVIAFIPFLISIFIGEPLDNYLEIIISKSVWWLSLNFLYNVTFIIIVFKQLKKTKKTIAILKEQLGFFK